MITVSISRLRNNIFELIDKVVGGETIVIRRKGKIVGRIIPEGDVDWRNRASTRVELCVDADEAFAPLEEIWEDYI